MGVEVRGAGPPPADGGLPLTALSGSAPATAPSGRRKRQRRRPSSSRRWGLLAGTGLLAGVVVLAPLMAGSVHRSTAIPVLLATFLALAAIVTTEFLAGVPLRISYATMAPFLAFLVIAAVQSLPLPSRLARLIDPAGADLLTGSPVGDATLRALSLDPPATWISLGQAAAALVTVVLAAQLMSGRSYRYLLLRAVTLAALAAVVIGVGHRILGIDFIYGRFHGSRGILNGPFINPNHTAEFLELGAFAALALAFAKANMINRVGWLAASVFLLAGALGTLSRGGVLAMTVAGALFAGLYRAAQHVEGDTTSRRRAWYVAILLVGLVAVVALSLGASQILEKFTQSSFSQETRFRLWRDALNLLWAHPFGIGRGAFDRAYPTVRSVEGNISVRFSFVENEPLQILIDTGWLGTMIIVVSLVLFARAVFRRRRGDRVELALVCGVVAVMVHNLVDFGLETLGVLLPFSVLVGAILGRTKNWDEVRMPRRRSSLVAAAAGAGLLVAVVAMARSASADFDARLAEPSPLSQRQALAVRAQAAHPVDYYYVLAEAASSPLLKSGEPYSPRLRILNRALQLCPRCPEVHVEVARSLWALGKRRQALNEWRLAVHTRPVLLGGTMEEVWRVGARPEELAQLAGDDPAILIQVATALLGKSDRAGARKVLDLIPMGSVPSKDILLLRADLDLGDGNIEQATKDLDAVEQIAPLAPRVCLLRAELALRAGGVNAALDVLDKGLAATPHDIRLQDKRLRLVMGSEKWSRAQAALDGLEAALFHAGESTTQVHTARGTVAAHLGDRKTAVAEFRAAINQSGGEVHTWMDLGRYYEGVGRMDEALSALREAQLKAPGDAGIAASIQRINDRKSRQDEAGRNRMMLGR